MSDGVSYEFGPFRIDARKRLLLRNGVPVPVAPKAYELLVSLARREGSLATKEELMREVWPDTIVDDGSLARTVSRLRSILDGPYIETLPKRGYRFVSVTRAKSLAVLPFTILGPPDSAHDYLGIGIADALITRLSGLKGLQVRPTSSVIRFARADVATAGRELRVDSVIEGRIQIHGAKARVTVQLVVVADERPVWGESIDGTTGDVLDLQHAVAERVASLVAGHDAEPRKRITTSDLAYQHYLRARDALFRMTAGSMQSALASLRTAVEIDPQFAAAYATSAYAYLVAAGSFMHPADATREARAAAAKALDLDESFAEAHLVLGSMRLWLEGDAEGAESEFRRALELAPDDPLAHHTYGWHLVSQGRFDEAQDEIDRAAELDPTNVMAASDRGLPAYHGGRVEEALETFRGAAALDPAFWYPRYWAGLALLALGRDAAAELDAAVALSHGVLPEPRIARGVARARAGQRDEAERLFDELRHSEAWVSPYELATLRLALDDRAGARALLDEARRESDKWLQWLNVDPRLASLRE